MKSVPWGETGGPGPGWGQGELLSADAGSAECSGEGGERAGPGHPLASPGLDIPLPRPPTAAGQWDLGSRWGGLGVDAAEAPQEAPPLRPQPRSGVPVAGPGSGFWGDSRLPSRDLARVGSSVASALGTLSRGFTGPCRFHDRHGSLWRGPARGCHALSLGKPPCATCVCILVPQRTWGQV